MSIEKRTWRDILVEGIINGTCPPDVKCGELGMDAYTCPYCMEIYAEVDCGDCWRDYARKMVEREMDE